MKQLLLHPLQKSVTKTIEIPGSKSYTNRALLMAALTKNAVTIRNPLLCDDTWAMIGCLKLLGISVELAENAILVNGSIADVKNSTYELNANLSATTLRFLLALICVVPGIKILKGNDGLNKRPVEDLVDSLKQLGASIEYLNKMGYPPLKVTSSKLLGKKIRVKSDVSSQFISSLLMIAPVIGGLHISSNGKQISKPYIDMTIDSMKKFGVKVTNSRYQTYTIPPSQEYSVKNYTVERDFSSAGYFFTLAALTNSTIKFRGLNTRSLQADKKLLLVLENMGNKITYDKNDITIRGSCIKPVTVNMIDFPDQAQTLAVLAAFADGKSTLTGLQSLHVKETDRLKATVQGLAKMGIRTIASHDTITIFGGNPKAATIDTYDDQRTAMSFAVAGAKLSGLRINHPDVVNKTFPDFWNTLEKIGMACERSETA